MKVAILCGGKGFRMREITEDMPKPLARVGGKPILWQIMKLYYQYGFDDFVLLLGYKGEAIKEYFLTESWKASDVVLDNRDEKFRIEAQSSSPKWKITFADTGEDTMTGSRIKRAQSYLEGDTFLLTYGDGIADVNIKELVDFHHRMGRIATLTGITGKSQYGLIQVKDGLAAHFIEKPTMEDKLINGGFFVLDKRIFDYIEDTDNCILEREPLMKLAEQKQLAVYEHKGLWTAIDTYKELVALNEDWLAASTKIFHAK